MRITNGCIGTPRFKVGRDTWHRKLHPCWYTVVCYTHSLAHAMRCGYQTCDFEESICMRCGRDFSPSRKESCPVAYVVQPCYAADVNLWKMHLLYFRWWIWQIEWPRSLLEASRADRTSPTMVNLSLTGVRTQDPETNAPPRIVAKVWRVLLPLNS